jgi:hypothetical protein
MTGEDRIPCSPDCLHQPCAAARVAIKRAQRLATVKRATLFDGVVDTFQTEAELNGFRDSQGRLL